MVRGNLTNPDLDLIENRIIQIFRFEIPILSVKARGFPRQYRVFRRFILLIFPTDGRHVRYRYTKQTEKKIRKGK